MKTILLLLIFSSILIFPAYSQTELFSEDFESGTASSEWGLFWANEETVQAVPMDSAPVALVNGGSYCGFLQDADGTFTGAAMALAGAVDANTINADIIISKINFFMKILLENSVLLIIHEENIEKTV